MADADDMKLWRQDLGLLWARWTPLAAEEQEWLLQDFVRRAEHDPQRLAGLVELVLQDLAKLESLDWLDGDNDLSPVDESGEDLPSIEELNLPESDLRKHREGLQQLYMMGQARMDALWLEGAQP